MKAAPAAEKKHIFITGERGVGKSTLVRRLIEHTDLPLYGFMTKMDPPDAEGYHEIYMYPAALPIANRVRGKENLIGRCDRVHHHIHPEVFAALGVELIKAAKPDGILIMDELGFMEAGVPAFREAVFEALRGDIPVLAVVKARYDVSFLNTVRTAEKGTLYTVTAENREKLFEELKNIYPFCG